MENQHLLLILGGVAVGAVVIYMMTRNRDASASYDDEVNPGAESAPDAGGSSGVRQLFGAIGQTVSDIGTIFEASGRVRS